jgi:hypothetical protein
VSNSRAREGALLSTARYDAWGSAYEQQVWSDVPFSYGELFR